MIGPGDRSPGTGGNVGAKDNEASGRGPTSRLEYRDPVQLEERIFQEECWVWTRRWKTDNAISVESTGRNVKKTFLQGLVGLRK